MLLNRMGIYLTLLKDKLQIWYNKDIINKNIKEKL